MSLCIAQIVERICAIIVLTPGIVSLAYYAAWKLGIMGDQNL